MCGCLMKKTIFERYIYMCVCISDVKKGNSGQFFEPLLSGKVGILMRKNQKRLAYCYEDIIMKYELVPNE